MPSPEDLLTQGLNPGLRHCGPFLVAHLVKNPPAMQETPVRFLVGKIPWRRDRLPTLVFLGFPCGSAGKESTCNVGELGLIPGLARSIGEGKGYPIQESGLENFMDYTVHVGFPGSSAGKESTCNVGDPRLIPGSGRSPGGGKGNPLQYSYLGNPMDRGTWQDTLHGVAKNQT